MTNKLVKYAKAITFIFAMYLLGETNEYMMPEEGMQVTFALVAIIAVIAWSEIKSAIMKR